MAYLGYDPCGLGVLLGALEAVAEERLPTGDDLDPWSVAARERHRRVVTAIAEFAEPVGAILRHDPLGRFRSVHLDPDDLRWWSVTRAGRWRTVTDPTALAGGPRLAPDVQNAQLLAGSLTSADPDGLWAHDSRQAASLVAYLERAADDRSVGGSVSAAFLRALGPDGFRRLLEEVGAAFDTDHQRFGPDPRRGELSRRLLDALGRLWAAGRAAGDLRTPAWDRAALGARLSASSRLLAIAAAAPGALGSDELGRWGGALWLRLVRGVGGADAPQPEANADDIVAAVANDGRAARGFLLDLAGRRDRRPLLFLLANVATRPDRTGALLLASTEPGSVETVADDRDVGRSLQAVLRAVDELLRAQSASFPVVRADGTTEAAALGWVVPTDLGLYVGRYLSRLVDPCDGVHDEGCPAGGRPGRSAAATVWPTWHDREVAGVLGDLVADRRVAAQLDDAALAAFIRDVGGRDLTAAGTVPPVGAGAFAVAAVGAVRRDHDVQRVEGDNERFQRMVGGFDLAVAAAGSAYAGAPVADAAKAWSWAGHVASTAGVPTPGRLVLAPFEPRSVRDELATARSDEALRAAVLQRTVARLAVAQLGATGAAVGPGIADLPRSEEARIGELAGRTRPGDNANAAAVAELDDVERWLRDHRGSPEAQAVERLLDAVGAAAARGAAWVA